MKIAVIRTNDTLLRDMLAVKLESFGLTVSFQSHTDACLLLIDSDAYPLPENVTAPVIAVGYHTPNTPSPSVRFFLRPVKVSDLMEAVRNLLDGESRTFKIDRNARRLTYGGYASSLSPIECDLLFALAEKGGEPVTRQELSSRFFPNATPDALTVYMHYLRRKTEADGQRRIYSLRNQGYALRTVGEEKIECST